MFYWIYDYPMLNIGVLFTFVFIATTWGGIFAFRRFFRVWFHRGGSSKEVTLIFGTRVSTIYGLLLGLIAVVVYQNHNAMNNLVTKEASSLAALYSGLAGYPQPIRGRLQDGLRDYTRWLIDEAWPQQRRGIVSVNGSHQTTVFVNDLMTFEPSDRNGEAIIHARTLGQYSSLVELRGSRLASVNDGLPSVFWWVLAIGAFINILMIVMLDIEVRLHLILGASFSSFLALIIYLIAMLDNPFRGQLSPGPEPFQLVYETLIKPHDTVRMAMIDMIANTAARGAPRIKGTDTVSGRVVPVLYFGATRINNVFDVVDKVVKVHKGTATVFVRDGDEYVRVSTNVKRSDGSRAMGTILDPKGPAIEQIRKGREYYGAATILGKPYVTAYEPIKDASDRVIGIYYVGYRLP